MELEMAKSLYLLELTLEQKRQVIEMLAETYPVQVACQLLDYARSRYYHQAQARNESQLKETVLQLAGQWPTYGYRRLKKQLEQDAIQVVDHNKLRRLMHELGLVVKVKRSISCKQGTSKLS